MKLVAARGLPSRTAISPWSPRRRASARTATRCAAIAADLDVDRSRVNLKATTTEGLGALGRGEGIAAQAIVLLREGDGA